MTLELFPKHPDMDAYRVGGAYQPYAVVAVDKRFTDAELAAEYIAADLTCWVRRARCNNYPGEDNLWDHYERGIDQLYTLDRFAQLPHYDE